MTNPTTQPGAAPATGNTKKEQEMYAAGLETGEANAKHNAAVRAAASRRPVDVLKVARETGLRSYLHGANAMEARMILQRFVDALPVASAAPAAPSCPTCIDRGLIGGPSFYAPDEGGVPCPDCAAPGVSTVEDKPAAYLTLDEEGSPSMLFIDVVEARTYCALGEEPEALYRRPAPAAGDALDLTLAQKYEDACILANANARDAARYRQLRKALTSYDTGWLDRIAAALEAMGLDPDEDKLPTPEQVDGAFDAAQRKGDA